MKSGLHRIEDALLSAPADDARRLDALLESGGAAAPPAAAPTAGDDDARTRRVKKLMIKELPVREQVWILVRGAAP